MIGNRIVISLSFAGRAIGRIPMTAAVEASAALETALPHDFPKGAAFDRLSITIGVGTLHQLEPELIACRQGWLEVNVYVEERSLKRMSKDELAAEIERIAGGVLLSVARKYGLDEAALREAIPTLHGVEALPFTSNKAPESDNGETDLIIQYPINGWGTDEDLDKRHTIEDLADRVLQRLGLGYCDGGDTGGGTMNVFCIVTDPRRAVEELKRMLEKKRMLEGAVLAYEQDAEYRVCYPAGGVLLN